MIISYIALIGRILLLALERIVVRILGNNEGDLYKNIGSTFLFFFIGAIFLLPFNFTVKIDSFSFLFPCYLSSLLYSIGAVSYVSSLATGETSLVTPINSLNSLILLILSFIFLGEAITITKFFGIIIIIIGLSILKKAESPIKALIYILKDKACKLMFVYVMLQSFGRILDKYFFVTVHPIVYSTVLYLFVSLNLLIFLLIKGKGDSIKSVFKEKKKISIFSGALNGFSYLFLLIALNNIQLSIAEPLTQISMILTLVFSYLFFKENIKEKIPGSILILIGGWLLLYNFN